MRTARELCLLSDIVPLVTAATANAVPAETLGVAQVGRAGFVGVFDTFLGEACDVIGFAGYGRRGTIVRVACTLAFRIAAWGPSSKLARHAAVRVAASDPSATRTPGNVNQASKHSCCV